MYIVLNHAWSDRASHKDSKEEMLTFSKDELLLQLISVKIKSQLLYVALHPSLRTTALMKALCNIKI